MTQTYDIHRTYQYNYDRGPVFEGKAPVVPDVPMKTFLGQPVRSRLGIAAGLLLNSKWISGYAARGFDVLTYKTVRAAHRPCYEPPNWVFVEEGPQGMVYVTERMPLDPRTVSSAVCFGMPSMAPEVWREDIGRARKALGAGQMLIVSVVATPPAGATARAVAEDFRRCAEWADQAGADVVEANFSCPNVCSAEGSIYMDPELSRTVAAAVREGIGSKPLLIKVGHVAGRVELEKLLRSLNGVASGVTLVNGITRKVLHRDGRPAFGGGFERAGVLGRTIHGPSVAQVRLAKGIVGEAGLDLDIAAVGGVSSVEDIAEFFEAGAGAVLMGSSPMYLPDLAIEAKARHPEW